MAVVRPDLVNYLRKSLVLQDPQVETDPAYVFTDEDLEEIISSKIKERNPSYTLTTLPEEEEFLVILLSKKEVYWRLATSSAPFYPISAEGASLQKDVRFDHYLALIREIEAEYARVLSEGKHIKIDIGEVLLDSRYFSSRNLKFAEVPKVNLKVDNVYSDKVELSWEIEKLKRSRFHSFILYIDNNIIIDKYKYNEVSETATKVEQIYDIHRDCYRIENLQPNTQYYIALEVRELNGLRGFSQVSVTTLP
ncbi:MAG: fibronectin type III domain-containing protein [Thermosipho sp. (in: Bacteria)]|nr:fibronectin type III domain-containing protein [Thermosipho sp. (in: thermotogales)]